MRRLLVVGGTADSSDFIQKAPREWELIVTVYSDQGEKVLPAREKMKVHRGGLDENGFLELIRAEKAEAVADLSHPFAAEVSDNVKAAAERAGVPRYRFLRAAFTERENRVDYPDFPAAAAGLKDIPGNILLTIGSRNLGPFLEDEELKDRCYMRVLADSRVLRELEEKSVDAGKIFAMKGVASAALNIALAKEVDAAAIVTKDSGLTGGLQEKYDAAKALNIPLIVVGRPEESGDVFTDIETMIAEIGRE